MFDLQRYMAIAAHQAAKAPPHAEDKRYPHVMTDTEQLDEAIKTFMRQSVVMKTAPVLQKIYEPWVPVWRTWFFPWLS